jgi:pyrroloquinoline-quinone synthase
MKKIKMQIIQNFGKILRLEMGANSEEIENVKQESFTKDLIDNFFKQGRSSYAEGLASLYTYERQIPEIAGNKNSRFEKSLWLFFKKRIGIF